MGKRVLQPAEDAWPVLVIMTPCMVMIVRMIMGVVVRVSAVLVLVHCLSPSLADERIERGLQTHPFLVS